MNPKTEALKFRIWQYAAPRGWDVTLCEIADALDERVQRVNGICLHAGWLHRVRRTADDLMGGHLTIGAGSSASAAQHIAEGVVNGKIEAWEPI